MRDATDDDCEFLRQLHRKTMQDYVGATWG
jgi:hypothetical protein